MQVCGFRVAHARAQCSHVPITAFLPELYAQQFGLPLATPIAAALIYRFPIEAAHLQIRRKLGAVEVFAPSRGDLS